MLVAMPGWEEDWECDVCGAMRSGAKIDVHYRKIDFGGVRGITNVRHCNDREACLEGARTFSFFRGTEGEESTDG